jgi:hypothetical protein
MNGKICSPSPQDTLERSKTDVCEVEADECVNFAALEVETVESVKTRVVCLTGRKGGSILMALENVGDGWILAGEESGGGVETAISDAA